MKQIACYILLISLIPFFYSCSVIEQSSKHGFESGYYKLKSKEAKDEIMYLDITEDNIAVYHVKDNQVIGKSAMIIPLSITDSVFHSSVHFSKKSFDIDITSILFKYRIPNNGNAAEMTTDFNASLYTGWRNDNYHIHGEMNPLGKYYYETFKRGYDFGIIAGAGSTLIGPFSTSGLIINEYNGIILEFGLAGFVETNVASFGIATGFDYLLSPDKNVWIYNNKPWLGLIVGIALN